MSLKLIELTDAHMTRARIAFPRPSAFYPSEASVTWTDEHGMKRVDGSCLRASYYRLTGEKGAPPEPHSEWVFALGKGVEKILVEQWKQMGIWVDNNVKFFDFDHGISGEIDVILAEPETRKLFGVEAKSFYGYYATKEICGNKGTRGAPKTNQLLQALIYVDFCKKMGIIDYFKLIYYARDSSARAEFDIDIVDDGGLRRPMVNGVVDYRFTIDEIYDRYKELKGYLDRNELPPRDYSMAYDSDKIEKLKTIGDVSKTAYEDWKKNPGKNPIGDWQCRYCPFQEKCWSSR